MATIRKNYESSVAKGRMTPEAFEQTMALITPTTTYDGFDTRRHRRRSGLRGHGAEEDDVRRAGAGHEAGVHPGVEHVDARHRRVRGGERPAGTGDRPPLLQPRQRDEAARNRARPKETSKEAIATSLALAKRLGKVGVVVGNCFGFVANRMLAYYMREALLLLEEGATVPQVDGALTEFGMPVGPFGMQDIAGIDVGWRIRQLLKSTGKTRAEGPQSEVPDRLYELGRYGQKTGAGWYRYEAGSRTRIPDPLVDQIAAEEAAKRGITRRTVHRRGDHRADHDRAGQRGRAHPRGRLRHPRQRHRRHLLLRLRLPAPRRRADVLRRHGRPADRARRA